MPVFAKPKFAFQVDYAEELRALTQWRDTQPGRAIPAKAPGKLLVASWNVANLGLQARERVHYRLIATMISWFDIVALQEVNDNLAGLRAIQAELPPGWAALFTDRAGNRERMTYLYDTSRVRPLELVGEIAIPVEEHGDIKLPNVKSKFNGFDRNPFLASFAMGSFPFVLVNVHLYYGKMKTTAQKKTSMERRSLEAFAVARWCDLRRRSSHHFTGNIIALGDFNLPKWETQDPIRRALESKGLRQAGHSTRIASNVHNDHDFDQILCFPGLATARFLADGVFDFDGAVFARLWAAHTRAQFESYVRYYLSDHRIRWAQFRA